MYNHQHAFSTNYASISPNAELKVHVFLNVAHQRGCKLVTTIFIPSLRRGRTDGGILWYYETRHGGESNVFSRQLSVHFGSISFLRRSIVPTSRSYADFSASRASSSGWTPHTTEATLAFHALQTALELVGVVRLKYLQITDPFLRPMLSVAATPLNARALRHAWRSPCRVICFKILLKKARIGLTDRFAFTDTQSS